MVIITNDQDTVEAVFGVATQQVDIPKVDNLHQSATHRTSCQRERVIHNSRDLPLSSLSFHPLHEETVHMIRKS